MSELLYAPKNSYDVMSDEDIKKVYEYCEGYKKFLDNSKIERLCVENTVKMAEKEGFKPFEYDKKYKAGDKVYYIQKKRAVIFAVIGSENPENGFNLIAAHIDSPRLDLKPNPLYEDSGFAMFKTHYYGGIRKYQWLTIPLMLVGVVCKTNGETINVNIGGQDGDPVFCITDLLPHLAGDQSKKPLETAYTGENLNILIGSTFEKDEKSDKYKLAVMKFLNKKYGIKEQDFLTAELSIVPVHKASDLGFDRSMICSYGQDDRICAYPAFTSLLESDIKKTAIVVFADKEEIGSVGQTGMRSAYIKNFIELLSDGYNVKKVFANSACISADVSAAFDPNFSEVYEKRNAPMMNCGPCMSKYLGRGGKSGSSEANVEFMATLCGMFEKNGVVYQTGELGKVDQGGGGTVSQFIADLDIEVVDMGVAVLSMHSPNEVAGKTDIYMMHKACKIFLENY